MDKDTQEQVRNMLTSVQSPVVLHLFTQDYSAAIAKRQIAEEVAELSDRVAARA